MPLPITGGQGDGDRSPRCTVRRAGEVGEGGGQHSHVRCVLDTGPGGADPVALLVGHDPVAGAPELGVEVGCGHRIALVALRVGHLFVV